MSPLDWIDATQNIVQILAIFAAGAWAYYHYFRGRTYQARLELGVSGQPVSDGTIDCLIVTASVRNVGLSRVQLQQRGTGVIVSTGGTIAPVQHVNWTALGAFPLFENHECIEPGEAIEQKLLVGLPAKQRATRLEARLNAAGVSWSADDIIVLTATEKPLTKVGAE